MTSDLPLLRRSLLRTGSHGLGGLALSQRLRVEVSPELRSRQPRRAKRVIWLSMAGGPFHLETSDYKPKLAPMDGQPMAESFTKSQQIAQLRGKELKCLVPQHSFAQGRNFRLTDIKGPLW
jgi:Protein of unknown function (DUF1501)